MQSILRHFVREVEKGAKPVAEKLAFMTRAYLKERLKSQYRRAAQRLRNARIERFLENYKLDFIET
nr:MAG TPA: hypothetical protein [Caudoviricetes sp.]